MFAACGHVHLLLLAFEKARSEGLLAIEFKG